MSDDLREDPGSYRIQRDALAQFNALVQRDSTNTTYKFALLRALVEIAEQDAHHVRPHDAAWVAFPLGLIVDRWLSYYYPFIANCIPQRHGERPEADGGEQLGFRPDFLAVTAHYAPLGGFPAFRADYFLAGEVPPAFAGDFARLVRRLRATITQFPMKHLGHSRTRTHYSIVDFVRDQRPTLGLTPSGSLVREAVVLGMGTALLRREWYEIFRALGGFATGTQSLVHHWARFTAEVGRHAPVSFTAALDALLATPDESRFVADARQVYESLLRNGAPLSCVWSDRRIGSVASLAVDHAIPYSLWGGNELWNLLPTLSKTNGEKSDRIPAPGLVMARAPTIGATWNRLRERFPARFDRDFELTLAGAMGAPGRSGWEARGIDALAEKCRYLIEERGFQPWQPRTA